jgi:hypothetical protein
VVTWEDKDEAEETVDSLYYKVIAVILLFPWSILALTVAGHFRARRARKVKPG